MAIEMIETTEQRDTDRLRDNAYRMLNAPLLIKQYTTGPARAIADEAIEYATGAHDPDCYVGTGMQETGYEVDAAGTALG